MRENMVQALGVEGERRVRFSAIAHAGKSVLELPKIWLQPLDKAAALIVSTSGMELAEKALQKGKGIIFLTPHLGCFEITAQYKSMDTPITVLYRPPKQHWLREIVRQGRIREQMHIATADLAGVRTLLKALKRGESVGILPDQTPQAGEGLWFNFFGRPAYTMTLAARLTENGAAVIMAVAERLPNGRGFHFRLSEPTQPITGTTKERAQKINHEIEHIILQYPEQYLWSYNRYKQPGGAPPPPDRV